MHARYNQLSKICMLYLKIYLPTEIWHFSNGFHNGQNITKRGFFSEGTFDCSNRNQYFLLWEIFLSISTFMHYTDMVMTVSCWRLVSGWELLVWTAPLVYPGGGSNCWPSTAGCIVFAQGVGGDLSRRENPMNTWVAGATCVSSGAPVEGYPPFDTWMGVTRCTSTTG